MIDKLKVFEVAWKEFVEWVENNSDWGYDRRYGFLQFTCEECGSFNINQTDHEFHGLCIEWLDSKNIKMWVESVGHHWQYFIKPKGWDSKVTQWLIGASRTEATEAGIIKAFEIYNQRGEK